jgi:hypothetical protein
VVGIFMDYQNSPIHLEYHESFTAIEMIYFFSRGEILGILFSVFIIFIPLNLFDALRVLNFYRVNHATSISNAKIVFSIVVTLFLLFFLCLSILTILFWLMLSKFDITRFDLFCNVLVGIYYQFSIYFFAGCGFIVLYLITRKKSLTILLGIALCLLFGLIENKADRGDLHPNWYLLICFHTPSLLYSDIVWQTKAFFWYYWSTYMCYWCSLLLLFLYYLSSFYPRGEHCNLKQRFFYRKYERNQEKWFYVPAILCCITCFCAFQIVNIHAKERKKYSQNSQIEICTKESNHKIRDGQ